MFGAIKHNLANLFNFSGQDSRSTFWWYFLFLFILWVIVNVVIVAPIVAAAVGTAMEGAQSGADQAAVEAQMEADVLANMTSLALSGLVVALVFALLLAASLVRRARDAGKPGWWGAVPVILRLGAAVIGYFIIQSVMGSIDSASAPDMDALMEVEMPGAIFVDIAGWLGLILAIVIGVLPSSGIAGATVETFE